MSLWSCETTLLKAGNILPRGGALLEGNIV